MANAPGRQLALPTEFGYLCTLFSFSGLLRVCSASGDRLQIVGSLQIDDYVTMHNKSYTDNSVDAIHHTADKAHFCSVSRFTNTVLRRS
jgi:hypothetical protein